MQKLFVRNLSFNTVEPDLNALFSNYGDVVSAKIAFDRETGRGRGFGFVEMSTQKSAEDAIAGLDNKEFHGRVIHVVVSEPRERRETTYSNNRW
ncbi:MAG: RNA-binding protein [Candidatus Obscuribacterales bacterium]|nr:RNA-binding protein [Candidatus Obscuribacterales bacterium]